MSRQRVDTLLDRIWQYPVTLVVAPAGSGKTTALRQFVARSAPVAWCSADALENAPDGCLAEIARLLGAAIGAPLDGSSNATLAAGIDAWPGERVALVIDDLHAIASTLAESELGRLIERRPAKLCVAAGTRSHPEFDLSRLRVDDQLLEITADDLRFRTWEADRLFREHYDMILGPTDVAMLITRTEGWAAGLQLYNLAARNQPLDARRRLIGELSATRIGRDYLARNVLSGLPLDLQSFLIDTSALPILTGPLCDRVTGRQDSLAVLEHLEHNQLFTIAIDQRGTYRYHEVMRAHLDACLVQRRGPEAALAHHRRIGELLEAEGRVDDALHAYSRAADWSAVSRLVVHRMAHPSLLGSVAGDAWIELVPAVIVENDPYLLLARARERTVNGRFGAAMRDYERAIAGATVDTMARTCEDERAVLAALVEAATPAAAGWLGTLVRSAQGEPPIGPPSHAESAEPARSLVRGLSLLVTNQRESAVEALFDVVRHELADSRCAAMAELGLAVAEAVDAAVQDAVPVEPARLEQAAAMLERCGLGWAARVGRAALALTTQREGRAAAREVHSDCLRDGDPWGAAAALLFDAIGCSMRGDDSSVPLQRAHVALQALRAQSLIELAGQFRTTQAGRTRAAAALSVRCFGSLELVIDHQPVDLSGIRPRALSVLRVLAMHAGRPVHREVLMESLWPDVEPDAARHSLQVAVSSLRKLLPATPTPVLVRHGDTYRLELGAEAFVDVRSFHDALSSATSAVNRGDDRAALEHASRAVDLYRGDLLLDEGPSEWVVGPRDTFRADVVRACSTGAEAALRLGIAQEATRLAERGLAIDRYADSLWRLHVESLEHASDRAAAERARRSWQEMMDELGV